ncbi:MAG: hypothetical protein IJ659_00715 [Alloprevotella sp.]|nr:hypothetical protein [Alloprevotella sp.]
METKDTVSPRLIPQGRILSDSAESTLKGIAIFILIAGLFMTLLLFFTVCFTKVPKGYYGEETSFNPQGFAITVATLLSSLATWAALNVFANISLRLKTLQEVFADATAVGTQPEAPKDTRPKSVRLGEMDLKPGDTIVRNIDGKEYEVKEVRSDAVLIYTGMLGGYRALSPDEFTLKK